MNKCPKKQYEAGENIQIFHFTHSQANRAPYTVLSMF